MLTLLLSLLAFLVTGSMSYEEYNPAYEKLFEGYEHFEKFPTVKYINPNMMFAFQLCVPNDNVLQFKIVPDDREGVHLETEDEIVLVISSLNFEFTDGEETRFCKFNLTLKSEDENQIWTVISPVYLPPSEKLEEARKHAVDSTRHFRLKDVKNMGSAKYESFDIEWALNTLHIGPPRCIDTTDGNPLKKEYAGLPQILSAKVVKKLDDLRAKLVAKVKKDQEKEQASSSDHEIF